MPRVCTVGGVEIGPGRPLAVIAGPCVLESPELGTHIAGEVGATCARLGLGYVFKASYDKANRTSITSPRGPGLARGLEWLGQVRDAGYPVTTDVHEPAQAETVAAAVDLLQVPAFLCRQTDLLLAVGSAAARHGRAVNVKKGQFVAPAEMAGPLGKLAEAGCSSAMLTERGTFFGYHRLVNDFLGVAEMMALDVPGGPPPVCFDVTHSTQRPGAGSGGTVSGGAAHLAPLLARAAVAAGVHAVFLECHPRPSEALSDAASMLPLDQVGPLLRELAAIRAALGSASESQPPAGAARASSTTRR
ncbi:MAG TPA: 3-deoxy-8-phosphooctulonate synthase [Phycisphaerales bacterium]|nr:3-deoxy-8-phosphooctulonate synthase [Phycisphaerales bacterium]